MAPLFYKVDLNKLWHDIQNEETSISAKFGKDLFSISKVIGRKKVAQFFLTHSVKINTLLQQSSALSLTAMTPTTAMPQHASSRYMYSLN